MFLLLKSANATLAFKIDSFGLSQDYIIFVIFIYHLNLDVLLKSGMKITFDK